MIGIGPADSRYPPGLLDLRWPPDPFWVEGDTAALASRAVSIAGTRRMTPYGAQVACELASACAQDGILVVSGLAQGVDSAAHQGALDARGATVAVLGAGIASYLADARGRRRRLAHAIRASGVLVSECSVSHNLANSFHRSWRNQLAFGSERGTTVVDVNVPCACQRAVPPTAAGQQRNARSVRIGLAEMSRVAGERVGETASRGTPQHY